MESKFQLTLNGQQVITDDFNLLGETSALADDRVFAELFRISPYGGASVAKGILPYAHQTSSYAGLVVPNGATGQVLVNPFRAFVGSRTTAATNGKDNWRDVRSTLSVGDTSLYQTVQLAANSSGDPRWDLVYASVSVDANGATVTRKRKDPATKAIAGTSVVTTLVTAVTVGVLQGTSAASPVWPTISADAGSTYYIPLAYVRVPNGFSASSTVLSTDIALQAPILKMSRAMGVNTLEVADQHYVVTTAEQQAWGSTGTRKPMFMPPDIVGATSLIVAMDFNHASSANWSHQHQGVIDSRDWRYRFVKWSVSSGPGGAALGDTMAWTDTSDSADPLGADSATATSPRITHGWGNTFNDDLLGSPNTYDVCVGMVGTDLSYMDNAAAVILYVDHADGGKLKVSVTGIPGCTLFAWLDFSAPYTNR